MCQHKKLLEKFRKGHKLKQVRKILLYLQKKTQGAIEIEKQEKNRTEELVLTTKLEDQLTIQTLVTLLQTATPPSQDLYRPSVEATPLQSSRPSPSTSKANEVTSCDSVSKI